ncbi:MAG: hypothetical protein K6U87_16010 [Firmicutes bacterium]|nr:hypothetical protein [Bacillota bacterium]
MDFQAWRELVGPVAGLGEVDGLSDRAAAAAIDPTRVEGVRAVRSYGSEEDPKRRLWWVRSREDLKREEELWARALIQVGVRPQDRVLVALEHPDWNQAVAAGVAVMGAKALVSAALGEPATWEVFRPTVAVMLPKQAYRLGRQGGLGRFERVVLWGDIGRSIFRLRAELCPSTTALAEVYALTEHPGPLAVECPAGQLHWLREGVAVEWVQPAELRGSALREVVVTDLEPRALPLYRYRTGDLVEVRDQPCPCGADGLVSSPVLGRLRDVIWLGGKPVVPKALADAVAGVPGVGEWQVSARWDRGRAKDLVAVDLTVEPGHQPESVLENVDRRVQEVSRWLTVRVSAVGESALREEPRFSIRDFRPAARAHLRVAQAL